LFTQVGFLASLFVWAFLAGVCNLPSHTKTDDILRTFSEESPFNLRKKKTVFVLLSIPPPPKQSFLKDKPLKKTSLANPTLAYVVRISQFGTRIKLEVLMPMRL